MTSNNEEEIKKLQNKLMLMGFSGMTYSEEWNKIAKELNNLKTKSENDERNINRSE